jgi:cytochrome c-type biogenesis protein CcmH/NrfG
MRVFPWFLVLSMSLVACGAARAAPFVPTSDSQVLERLPSRAADPRARDMARMRQQLAASPRDMGLAVQLARRYHEEVAAEGDPRYIGYAQAALAPWWNEPEPPVPVRVVRAILKQFSHGFDAALVDLKSAVRDEPDNAEAWSWLAAIAMVQARYDDARAACLKMGPLLTPLIGVACVAAVDSTTGQAAKAVTDLHAGMKQAPEASPVELLWVLTRLAETEDRLGHYAEAEAAYVRAEALGVTDGYLLAAHADFLLDRGRPAEVLTLLRGKERSDLLLLRLAIAGKALKAPEAAGWSADLTARFDAARLRGDTVHQKEEARFALAVLGDAQRALPLASANFVVQLEPADARMLLEAALAAGQPAAAEPALKWLAASGIESQVLRTLAARLKVAS